mmetsp:Transcript_26941/g.65429  ORF Transcript_26941/g.65429 Transcript_26941/m.65429 type:complete len:211 (-) Transcript_26941:596-1228(-)
MLFDVWADIWGWIGVPPITLVAASWADSPSFRYSLGFWIFARPPAPSSSRRSLCSSLSSSSSSDHMPASLTTRMASSLFPFVMCSKASMMGCHLWSLRFSIMSEVTAFGFGFDVSFAIARSVISAEVGSSSLTWISRICPYVSEEGLTPSSFILLYVSRAASQSSLFRWAFTRASNPSESSSIPAFCAMSNVLITCLCFENCWYPSRSQK